MKAWQVWAFFGAHMMSCATPTSTTRSAADQLDGGANADAGAWTTYPGDPCPDLLREFKRNVEARGQCATDADCVPAEIDDTSYQCTAVNAAWWQETRADWNARIHRCIRATWARPICCPVVCVSGRCRDFAVADPPYCTLGCPKGSRCWEPRPENHHCWQNMPDGLCVVGIPGDAGLK